MVDEQAVLFDTSTNLSFNALQDDELGIVMRLCSPTERLSSHIALSCTAINLLSAQERKSIDMLHKTESYVLLSIDG